MYDLDGFECNGFTSEYEKDDVFYVSDFTDEDACLNDPNYNMCNYDINLPEGVCLEQSVIDIYVATFCGIPSGLGNGFIEVFNPATCALNFVNQNDCLNIGASYVTKDVVCYLQGATQQSSCIPSNICSKPKDCTYPFCYSKTIVTSAQFSQTWDASLRKCVIQLDPNLFDYTNYCISQRMALWEGRTFTPASSFFGSCSINGNMNDDRACVGSTAYDPYTVSSIDYCDTISCDLPCSRCVPQKGYNEDDLKDGVCIKITTGVQIV